jgi:hypothetical protein
VVKSANPTLLSAYSCKKVCGMASSDSRLPSNRGLISLNEAI